MDDIKLLSEYAEFRDGHELFVQVFEDADGNVFRNVMNEKGEEQIEE